MSSNKPTYRDRSVLIHGKFTSEKWDFENHILPPITTSVAFRLGSGQRGAEGFKQYANPELDRETLHPIYIYSRLDEPTQALLEETLAFAEKGETAVTYATGMAAVSAVLGIHLKAGEHLVSHKTIYGCTYSLITNWLKRFGIEHTFVDFRNEEELVSSIKLNTRVLYFETPTNPTMDLIDIEKVVNLAKEINKKRSEEEKIVTILDNTFATPFCQRPLTMGIDFVVHSMTKNIGGFGADMGGVVIGSRKKETELLLFRKDFGGSLSPKAAWDILVFGLPTLAMRVERQQATAQRVAEYLEIHSKVESVTYPGLESFPARELALKQMRDIDGNFAPGSMIYFELKGSPEEAYEKAVNLVNHIADNALSVTLAVSLGQIRTLIQHPASMTHSTIPPEEQEKAGISPRGLRLSIGLEDCKDIIGDLEAALENS